MKINDILKEFDIYVSNAEREMLTKLHYPRPLSSFPEHEQFIIEGLIRKSLVIKIGDKNPRVIANEI
jgi:hypothetical protein